MAGYEKGRILSIEIETQAASLEDAKAPGTQLLTISLNLSVEAPNMEIAELMSNTVGVDS